MELPSIDSGPAVRGDVSIRKCPPDDREGVRTFWKRYIPLGSRVCEIHDWRESNPVSGRNCVYVAEENGSILGVANWVPATFGCRGLHVPVAWAADNVVASEARRRGIASRLLESVPLGASLALAKGTSAAMYTVRKKLGYRDVAHRTYQICAVAPFCRTGPASRRLAHLFAYAAGLMRRRFHHGSSLRISSTTRFGSEFDRLAETAIAANVLMPWKTSAYLEWRYGSGVPGRSYRILRADGTEGLRGAIVLRGPEGVEQSGWIVDLIAVPHDIPAIDALICSARTELKNRGTTLIRVLATSSLVRERLRRAGFLDTAGTPQFTYFQTSELPFDPASLEWNFFEGDADNELY